MFERNKTWGLCHVIELEKITFREYEIEEGFVRDRG
jgi:hypothetical protein